MKVTRHLGRNGWRRSRRSGLEAGITTAEYAVGTAAGAGFAGLLYTLLTGASATSCWSGCSSTS